MNTPPNDQPEPTHKTASEDESTDSVGPRRSPPRDERLAFYLDAVSDPNTVVWMLSGKEGAPVGTWDQVADADEINAAVRDAIRARGGDPDTERTIVVIEDEAGPLLAGAAEGAVPVAWADLPGKQFGHGNQWWTPLLFGQGRIPPGGLAAGKPDTRTWVAGDPGGHGDWTVPGDAVGELILAGLSTVDYRRTHPERGSDMVPLTVALTAEALAYALATQHTDQLITLTHTGPEVAVQVVLHAGRAVTGDQLATLVTALAAVHQGDDLPADFPPDLTAAARTVVTAAGFWPADQRDRALRVLEENRPETSAGQAE